MEVPGALGLVRPELFGLILLNITPKREDQSAGSKADFRDFLRIAVKASRLTLSESLPLMKLGIALAVSATFAATAGADVFVACHPEPHGRRAKRVTDASEGPTSGRCSCSLLACQRVARPKQNLDCSQVLRPCPSLAPLGDGTAQNDKPEADLPLVAADALFPPRGLRRAARGRMNSALPVTRLRLVGQGTPCPYKGPHRPGKARLALQRAPGVGRYRPTAAGSADAGPSVK
jgi:hypothetical protein